MGCDRLYLKTVPYICRQTADTQIGIASSAANWRQELSSRACHILAPKQHQGGELHVVQCVQGVNTASCCQISILTVPYLTAMTDEDRSREIIGMLKTGTRAGERGQRVMRMDKESRAPSPDAGPHRRVLLAPLAVWYSLQGAAQPGRMHDVSHQKKVAAVAIESSHF